MLKKKKKSIGAIKPSFTADRFFIYLVGGIATLAGLWVIAKLVQNGLEQSNLTPKLPTNSAQSNNVSYSEAGAGGYQEGLTTEEMKRVQQYLMNKGYDLGYHIPTGIAGPKTYDSVRKAGFTNARQLLQSL